jgi:hypothetical protein
MLGVDFVSIIKGIGAAGKSLASIARLLTTLNKEAKGAPDLQVRVILYLRSAQEAVRALGTERQDILQIARRCDVGSAREIEALWKRMDTYLFRDRIRKRLQDAVDGLKGCGPSITTEAEKLSWRRKQKTAAATTFAGSLSELEKVLGDLKVFSMPGSGMGVTTLQPIYNLLTQLRDHHKRKTTLDHYANEKLGSLIINALQDPSDDEWVRNGGKVERLVAELETAFNWKDLRAPTEPADHIKFRSSNLPTARRVKVSTGRTSSKKRGQVLVR